MSDADRALKALDYAARCLRAAWTDKDGDGDERRMALLVGAEKVRRLAEHARQAIADAP